MASLNIVSSLSEGLRKICRKHEIRTVFTTPTTLRQQLTRVKDIDPPQKVWGGISNSMPLWLGIHWGDKENAGDPSERT